MKKAVIPGNKHLHNANKSALGFYICKTPINSYRHNISNLTCTWHVVLKMFLIILLEGISNKTLEGFPEGIYLCFFFVSFIDRSTKPP